MMAAARLRRRGWWYGEFFLVALPLGVVLLSVVIQPSDDMLHLWGVEIPILCGSRRLFGIDCLGCGLTRSFVYIGHAQIRSAFSMNVLGPPFYALVVALVPYRIWRIFQVVRRLQSGA